jgi:hypothetical protein
MTTCGVCCERLNKTNHKKVTCPFCDFESCRSCSQTYLLSTTEDAHCMSCKKVYTRDIIDSFCTKRFKNCEYKKHKERILFERELARMPETQPYVQRILKRQRLGKLREFISNTYIKARRRYIHATQTNNGLADFYITMSLLLENAHRYVRIELESIRFGVIETKPTFIRGCPSENCRGFLDDLWKCGICETSFCDKCNEECLEGHTCDPELVKTMKLINRDTKPCPKCSTMIYKIDGCAQMWCTSCQTAFDWRTGIIEKGRIHNPHFFEFQSRSREHGDIPCGGRPMYRELIDENAPPMIMRFHYIVTTVEHLLAYRYGFIYEDNMSLRIEYLMNKIDDEYMKWELQKRDKYNDKMNDIRDIHQMFLDTGGDLLRQWIVERHREEEIIHTAHELCTYFNGVCRQIHARYDCVVPHYIFLS